MREREEGGGGGGWREEKIEGGEEMVENGGRKEYGVREREWVWRGYTLGSPLPPFPSPHPPSILTNFNLNRSLLIGILWEWVSYM